MPMNKATNKPVNNCINKAASFNLALSRRQLLSLLLASGMAPLLKTSSLKQSEFFVSAQGNNDTTLAINGFLGTSNTTQHVLTNFRGHGVAQNPVKPESVVMFARRPGKYGIDVDLHKVVVRQQFNATENHSMMGHGCFSADGKYLFTAEADNVSGQGKIVVRDVQQYYQPIAAFDSYGIGPHEIKLMPDAKTLVVANGGILTRPETGRNKLNLSSMRSSLTYIDVQTGNKLDDFSLNEAKASIRHVDVTEDGAVVFATQVQREAMHHNAVLPLAGVHKPGEAVYLFERPSAIIAKMNDYMGSVAVNTRTRIAGFTSPRGGLAAFWHIDSREFVGYHRFHDVCGMAVSNDMRYFAMSNSTGEIRQLTASTLEEDKAKRIRVPDVRWDNHMISVMV